MPRFWYISFLLWQEPKKCWCPFVHMFVLSFVSSLSRAVNLNLSRWEITQRSLKEKSKNSQRTLRALKSESYSRSLKYCVLFNPSFNLHCYSNSRSMVSLMREWFMKVRIRIDNIATFVLFSFLIKVKAIVRTVLYTVHTNILNLILWS